MPQYHNRLLAEAERLNEQASNVFDSGTEARERSEKYVRTTVLLATVLFLIAVSQRFGRVTVRASLLAVALVLLTYSLVTIATYPRA
jgi:hypothetical protein